MKLSEVQKILRDNEPNRLIELLNEGVFDTDTTNDKVMVLYEAYRIGEANFINSFLDRESDLDLSNGGRYLGFLISETITKGDPRFLKRLLDMKANPNHIHSRGNSILIIACKKSNIDAVKLLVNHGADLNYRCNFGLNPLATAVIKKDLEIVRFLLSKGSDINTTCFKNETPMIRASRAKSERILKTLIKYKPDYLVRSSFNSKTALEEAIDGGNKNIIKILAKYQSRCKKIVQMEIDFKAEKQAMLKIKKKIKKNRRNRIKCLKRSK